MRILGFDFLRGICAIGVAVYHLCMWEGVLEWHVPGLYGVYVFFVLSGASLTIVYRGRIAQGLRWDSFFLLRCARIFPLYLFAVALGVAARVAYGEYDLEAFYRTILNLFLVFGLGNAASTSIVVGGWSLGIEMVFYVIFPFVLAAVLSPWRYALAAMACIAQLVFVQFVFMDAASFPDAVFVYTQPLAFIAYFYVGCLIGGWMLDRRRHESYRANGIAVALFCLLVGFPVSSALDAIVGVKGLVLFSLSCAVCFFAGYARVESPSWQRACDVLGRMSYGMYLLHPIVYQALTRVFGLDGFLVIMLTLPLAAGLALLSEHYVELPIRNRFKRRLQAGRRAAETA